MGETIALKASDGFELDAYRARPAGKPRGAIVVVQEVFGVNEHIRAVADGFAQAGYLAVAPALYDRLERDFQVGYNPEDITRGREMRAKADLNHVMADLAAAAESAAEAGKVGIVGYCWGGLLVYIAACRLGDRLVCGSSYYGANIMSFIKERPAVPLMLHFGTLDASIPLSEVEQIRRAHPALRVHVYEDADHGFNCDQRRQYNAEAARLGRQRTLEFFAKHIG